MLRFTLNGTQIEIEDGENRTLLEYLRNVKCMKGTKRSLQHRSLRRVQRAGGRQADAFMRDARAPTGRQSR